MMMRHPNIRAKSIKVVDLLCAVSSSPHMVHKHTLNSMHVGMAQPMDPRHEHEKHQGGGLLIRVIKRANPGRRDRGREKRQREQIPSKRMARREEKERERGKKKSSSDL